MPEPRIDSAPEAGHAGDARAAARGSASLLVLQTFARIAALAFLMLLTRHLGLAEVGRYSTVAALVVFANFLADFGTSPAITRIVSRDPEEAKRLLSGTLLASLLFGMVIAAGVAVFGMAVYSGPTVVDVAIGSLAIPGASMLSSVLGALDGAGLIARRAVVTALQTLVIALGVVPVVVGAGVRSAVVALAVAPWIALAVAARMARGAGLWHLAPRVDVSQLRRLLRSALPFALSGGLSALMLRFDVILLSLVRTPAETASYDLAMRLLEATAYLGAAVGGPMLFVLSRRLGTGDRDGARRAYGEAIRLLYMLGLPLSIGMFVLAKPVISAALGAEFAAAATPLAIMGAGQWLTFLIIAQGALVMGGDSLGRGIAVGALNAIVMVVLDVVLVPRHGAVGAAWAMLASWIFSAIALDVFHRRTVGFRTPLPSPRLLVAAAVTAAVLSVLRHDALVVSVPAGALAYGAALFLTGAVTSKDVARLVRTVRPA